MESVANISSQQRSSSPFPFAFNIECLLALPWNSVGGGEGWCLGWAVKYIGKENPLQSVNSPMEAITSLRGFF